MKELTLDVRDEEFLLPNVFAVSSLCEDGMHILIWDFDITDLYKVEKSLSVVQNKFFLSSIYVLETRNGFNAICVDKLQANQVYNIKNETQFDDDRHNEFGFKSNNWKFRLGKEKKHVSTINCNYTTYNKSNAHRKMLYKFYRISILKDFAFDYSENIKLDSYWCWKEECENTLKFKVRKDGK
jgi:hypothetical protein